MEETFAGYCKVCADTKYKQTVTDIDMLFNFLQLENL